MYFFNYRNYFYDLFVILFDNFNLYDRKTAQRV